MGDEAGTESSRELPRDEGSLRAEAGATAGAVVAHIKKVAATASAEAELSLSAVVAIAAAAVASLLLLVSGWLCLIAAAVWFAAAAGVPAEIALLVAAVLNLAVVLLMFLRGKRLLGDIGFSRTLKLVLPGWR